jgi:hypothetical protein
VKRAAVALAGILLGVAGIDALGDLTQDRPDPPRPGSRSEIVLRVSARGAGPDAADRLWAACEGTVRVRSVPPHPVFLGDGTWRVVTEPAVGPRAWKRLRGCLEDLTLDRVLGRVVSKVDLPAAR